MASLFRQSTQSMHEAVGTHQCTSGVINYLSKKKSGVVITAANVYPEYLELLQKKGLNAITDKKVEAVVTLLGNAETDRLVLFNAISSWTTIPYYISDKPPLKGQLRDLLTIPSTTTLASSTADSMKLADPSQYFCTEWKKCKTSPTILPYESREFKYIKESSASSGIHKDETFRDNFKPGDQVIYKPCGTCWLCGFDINVYAIKKPDDAEIILVDSCGEMEHVLPPGIGNLIGLLGRDKTETDALLLTSEIAKYGLKPSHAWCNKVKDNIGFIAGSKTTGYHIDEKKLSDFYEKVDIKHTAAKPLFWSYEYIFKKNGIQHGRNNVDLLLNGMKKNIPVYLNQICAAANQISLIPGDSINTVTLLRTIVYGYQMFFNIIRKVASAEYQGAFTAAWSKAGGSRKQKKMKGGQIEIATDDDIGEVVGGIDELRSKVFSEDCRDSIVQHVGMSVAEGSTGFENLYENRLFGKISSLGNYAPKPAVAPPGFVFGQKSQNQIVGYIMRKWNVQQWEVERLIHQFGLSDTDIFGMESLHAPAGTPFKDFLIHYFSKKYNIHHGLVTKYLIDLSTNSSNKVKRMIELKQEGKQNNEINARLDPKETILSYLMRIGGYSKPISEAIIRTFGFTDNAVPIFEDVSRRIGSTNFNQILAQQIHEQHGVDYSLIYKHLTATGTLDEMYSKIYRMIELKREGKQNNEINARLHPKETILHYLLRIQVPEDDAKEIIKELSWTDDDVHVIEEITRRIGTTNIIEIMIHLMPEKYDIELSSLVDRYLRASRSRNDMIRKIKTLIYQNQSYGKARMIKMMEDQMFENARSSRRAEREAVLRMPLAREDDSVSRAEAHIERVRQKFAANVAAAGSVEKLNALIEAKAAANEARRLENSHVAAQQWQQWQQQQLQQQQWQQEQQHIREQAAKQHQPVQQYLHYQSGVLDEAAQRAAPRIDAAQQFQAAVNSRQPQQQLPQFIGAPHSVQSAWAVSQATPPQQQPTFSEQSRDQSVSEQAFGPAPPRTRQEQRGITAAQEHAARVAMRAEHNARGLHLRTHLPHTRENQVALQAVVAEYPRPARTEQAQRFRDQSDADAAKRAYLYAHGDLGNLPSHIPYTPAQEAIYTERKSHLPSNWHATVHDPYEEKRYELFNQYPNWSSQQMNAHMAQYYPHIKRGGSRRKARGHQKKSNRTRSKRPQKNRKWQTRSKRPQKKSKKNRLNRK